MNTTHRPVLLAEAVTALTNGPLIQHQNAAQNILALGLDGLGEIPRSLRL